MAKTVLDILAANGAITKEQAAEAKERIKDERRPIDEVATALGVSERDFVMAQSELLKIPVKFLNGRQVPFDVLKAIPEDSARFYQTVPLGEANGMLEVGMVHPEDVNAQEALKFISSRMNRPFKVFLVTPSDLKKVLESYRGLSGEVTEALSQFSQDLADESVRIAGGTRAEPGGNSPEEAPITKMVAVILRHAVEGRASDIHVEPGRDKLRVRFRVDGVLYTSLFLPLNVHSAVITRIKIMSNLKIDEMRVPQDGRFHAQVVGKEIDVRVATFPTSFGEKVVMRILDPEVGIKTLPELGLEGRNLAALEEAIRRPYGLIVISGPTGSGKSTTLYALLNILNQEGRNIVSLEDPIEYLISGVNQSQVRPEIGYDFANGLRQILRQDPDIIMVGEIRDGETAQLAIHAALTGHLVLTTLHTNNAVGIVPRLVDMGVEPFLLSSTLVLGVAQRLARRLCEDSRKEVKIEGRAREIIDEAIADMPQAMRSEYEAAAKRGVMWEGVASPTCPKATRGRIGLFEVVEMTPELEKIILTGISETKIQAEARRQGMATMRQDGIQKVLQGAIGIRELLEVV
ncbi:type II/IV secretion system protein [Candidatus Parcubacteria bacterium]|nr:MAG: type II/IV secretion system protein [Candidatus Parcubacteria bacterium]